jgi:hypothetical protein
VTFVSENPEETVAEAPEQVTQVASETAGYLAPGGSPRLSTRDRILRRRGYKTEHAELEEEDGTITPVEVRSLTLGERAEMYSHLIDDEGKYHGEMAGAYAVLYMAHDPETGERLFAPDDIDNISNLDSAYIEPVVKATNKITGGGKTADENREDEAKKS